MDKKIIVGMSGGIDSTISILLLKKQGWAPIGVNLKIFSYKKQNNNAKKMCEKLKIPYYELDVKKEFKKQVINYFLSELKKGRTPNPCMTCNPKLKFKKLIGFAKEKGIKYVATGHYAKTKYNSKTKKYELLRPKDSGKDQTYGLSFLPQKWLGKIKFPLADYTKKEIYKLAEKEGLNDLLKQKQSQDLCFVFKKKLAEFLEKEIGMKKGLIRDEKGTILTQHKGIHFYTIGQKKGIGLHERYYVKDLDAKKNEVTVTKNRKTINKKEMILSPFNFLSGEMPKKKMRIKAKVRYNQELTTATLIPISENKLKIKFEKPRDSVAKGQFCAFYKGEVCIGAGVINEV